MKNASDNVHGVFGTPARRSPPPQPRAQPSPRALEPAQRQTAIYTRLEENIRDMYQRAFAGVVVDRSRVRAKPILERKQQREQVVEQEYSSVNRTKDIAGASPARVHRREQSMPISSLRNDKETKTAYRCDPGSKERFLDRWTANKTVYEAPPFLRDTLDVSDIRGTSPRSVRKQIVHEKYSDPGDVGRPPLAVKDPLDKVPAARRQRFDRNRLVDNSLAKSDLGRSFPRAAVSRSPLRATNRVDDIAGTRPGPKGFVRAEPSNPLSPRYSTERVPEQTRTSLLKFIDRAEARIASALQRPSRRAYIPPPRDQLNS